MSKSPCVGTSEAARRFDPRHADLGGRAVLFENVEGCDFPLAMNLFGSYRRMEIALGCADRGGFEAIAAKIASLTKPQPPRSLGEALAKAREFLPLLRIGPKLRRRGVCQEVVRLASKGEVDLRRLPLIKCWPLDGDPAAVDFGISAQDSGTAAGAGRYLTFGGMHTIHADDRDDPRPASHNIGMYRAQLVDATRLAMHWHMHHDGAHHWRSWKKLGKPMPIAIAFGGESVLPYAATAPLPPGLSELLMAGFLNGGGIPLVRCKTVPLRVPANSEIVIEGYVSTECGPIGFDPPRRRRATSGRAPSSKGRSATTPASTRCPIATRSSRSPRSRIAATRSSRRPSSACRRRRTTTSARRPSGSSCRCSRRSSPTSRTTTCRMFGCFHNCAFVQHPQGTIRCRRDASCTRSGAPGRWRGRRSIVVVDETSMCTTRRRCCAALLERCDFRRDLELVNGPLDILDHAAPYLGAGGKIGFDATTRWAGEEGPLGSIAKPGLPSDSARADAERALASAVGTSGIDAASLPRESAGGVAAIAVEPDADPSVALEAAAKALGDSPAGRWLIAVESGVAIDRLEPLLFRWVSNADPERDCRLRGTRLHCDATTKSPGSLHGMPVRDFPPLVSMSKDVETRVESRFAESLSLSARTDWPTNATARR